MWKVLSQGIYMCNMKALSLLVWKLWPRLKFFKSMSNFKVKVTMSKKMVPCERSGHKEYTCAIWKPYHFWFESYGLGLNFFKSRSNFKVRSQGKKLWYHVKGLVTTNTHVQYESLIASCLKVMAKVKVFVYTADGRAMTLSPRTFVLAH